MGFVVLVAIACMVAAFMSGRNYWWHRACARILVALVIGWEAFVGFVVFSKQPHVRDGDLVLILAVPVIVYFGAILLRWVLSPFGERPPIISLVFFRLLARELWFSALRWSARFGVSHLN